MQITTLDKTERWLMAVGAMMAVLALAVAAGAAWLLLGDAAGTGQVAGAVLATPAGTAVSQAQAEGLALSDAEGQATRAAQLVAGYAADGAQPTRLEMTRLELSGAGQVTAAHSGPLRGAALAASVQQCADAGRQVSNRLYVEFGPGPAQGTLTFFFRAPAGRWQIVAEVVAGPERTGQMAGQVTVAGGAEAQVVTMPVTLPGDAGGLSLYALRAGGGAGRCDPAEGAFIGRPVLAK